MLEIARSTYYLHKNKEKTAREKENELLKTKIMELYTKNNSCYGTKRIRNALLKEYAMNAKTANKTVAYHRVRRLMRELNISGIVIKKHKNTPKNSDNEARINIIKQDFYPIAPNKAWRTDITYIRVNGSWNYLTTIMDLFSRKIVGWSFSASLKAEKTIISALKNAYKTRGAVSGTIVHSDQCCQYTSKKYLDLLAELKLLPSYSKKGYPYDNSPLESFNSTIKRERINRDFHYNTLEARNTIFAYIEGFYNKSRQHSALGYRSL